MTPIEILAQTVIAVGYFALGVEVMRTWFGEL